MTSDFIKTSFPATTPALTKAEFEWIKAYLHNESGILLNESKRAMVMGRLSKRLRNYGLSRYMEYFQMLTQPNYAEEACLAIDLLTTNKTYFFREPQHFDFLIAKILLTQPVSQPLRVWSAASSSGEEVYTIAMLLAEYAKSQRWEVIGSDISAKVLAKARRGVYPMADAKNIPLTLLKNIA